jgi:hypothetical protein
MRLHSNGVARWAAAAVAYTALTGAMYFPVVAAFFSRIPNDPGDPLLNTWLLWWNATTVPFTTAWWNGAAYWPLRDTLAFSEHLIGLAPVSTPLIWLGVSPLVVYNLLFLASWPLCALAAHALAYRLTGRHDAGVVAGLVFGFNPYRVTQAAHLQVLASWWMPLALLALHRAAGETDRKRQAMWIGVFALSWLLQSLTNGYLLFYFSIVVALWLAWFATARAARRVLVLAAGGGIVGIAALMPMLLKYRAVHSALGLRRLPDEILLFSGDLLSFVSATRFTALWPFRPLTGWERELYPGVVAVILVGASAVVAFLRSRPHVAPRRIWLVTVGVSAAFALVATLTAVIGRWTLDLGLFALSGARFRKPLTMAIASAVVALALSRRAQSACRARSVFAFYVAATVLCGLMCLGPVGRVAGEPVLEHPPYSWLVTLPGFSGLRVPTRFALVGTLTLAVAAAVGVTKLVEPRRRALALAIAVALAADGWAKPLPTFLPPEPYRLPDAARSAAVLELPLGTIVGDVAAMYRGALHRRPVVNGYSGHAPPPYELLRVALGEGDWSVLESLATYGSLCVVVDRRNTTPGTDQRIVESGGYEIGSDGPFTFYGIDRRSRPVESTHGRIDLRVATSGVARRLDGRLLDGSLDTYWATRTRQRGGEWFAIPLSDPVIVSGVAMTLGERFLDYPRVLTIETSRDPDMWEPAWRGPTSPLAYLSVMDAPRRPRIVIPFTPRPATRIRLRQTGSGRNPWSIAELEFLTP